MCFTLAQIDGRPGACHLANAFLDISNAKGRSIEEIANAVASQGNPDIPVIRTNITIAGENAVLLDDIYAYDVLRKVVILHNDRLYEFTFVPWGEGSGELLRIQDLYSALTESFTFLETTQSPATSINGVVTIL